MTLNERFSDELFVFGSEFKYLLNEIYSFVIANAVKQSFDAVVGVFFTNDTCESKRPLNLSFCFRRCCW